MLLRLTWDAQPAQQEEQQHDEAPERELHTVTADSIYASPPAAQRDIMFLRIRNVDLCLRLEEGVLPADYPSVAFYRGDQKLYGGTLMDTDTVELLPRHHVAS